jgi:hypothetical protein
MEILKILSNPIYAAVNELNKVNNNHFTNINLNIYGYKKNKETQLYSAAIKADDMRKFAIEIQAYLKTNNVGSMLRNLLGKLKILYGFSALTWLYDGIKIVPELSDGRGNTLVMSNNGVKFDFTKLKKYIAELKNINK